MKINRHALDIALAKAMLNRRELAKKSGVSESLLSKAYNGYSGISPKAIGKLARALDVPVESLVEQPNESL